MVVGDLSVSIFERIVKNTAGPYRRAVDSGAAWPQIPPSSPVVCDTGRSLLSEKTALLADI